MRTHLHPIGTMACGVIVPPIWKAEVVQVWFLRRSYKELKDDEHINGPPRPFALSPTTITLL
jgi:hypothetical protein